jgi:hypothetical protein
MRSMRTNLAEQRQRVADLQAVLSKFVISAPSDGMVIYKRDRSGAKRKVGSSISPWDNVVATLPDMSSMISKTYVNEIDVSKVKVGQSVDILVDAFPDKKYTGTVTSVANIGEQLPNADAKVFEVSIKLNASDPLLLKPSMTTGNKVITKSIPDVTYIPLESVQAGIDSIPFVYMKNGSKQIVVLGESNENMIIVEQGINPGDILYLNTPEDPENFNKIVGEDLIAVIKEKIRAEKEAERKANEQQARPGGFGGRGGFGGEMTPEMRQQLQNMRNGGTMDTAAMRRFREMRQRDGGQEGTGTRQSGQQGTRQEGTRQQGEGTQRTQQTTDTR